MLIIDGSYGEGGGQILRTSLALAAILGRPIRIEKIRAGRKNAGLAPQHLTAARAAAAITGGSLQGDEVGSRTLEFEPGRVKSGSYTFDVAYIKASSGSVALILQTILIPLALSGGGRLTLRGGTHVPWSPTVNYVDEVYLPTLARMGLLAYFSMEQAGYYPIGGGLVHVDVRPTEGLKPIDIRERGELKSVACYSAVSNLPLDIADRQLHQGVLRLSALEIEPVEFREEYSSPGKGTLFFIAAKTESGYTGFSALGERGKRAERVADEACDEFATWFSSRAALDRHLADQMILPMALAGGGAFSTARVTRHLISNIWVAEQFLPVRFEVEGEEGGPGTVRVSAVG